MEIGKLRFNRELLIPQRTGGLIMPSLELPQTVRLAHYTPVQISAFVARQKVNVLVLEQVSNLFLADDPTLVEETNGSGASNWVWRVPVDLTFPSWGRVGRVGELEVDARYGQVRYTQAQLDQMATEAQRLVVEVRSRTK
jgi:hypothetical protein